MYKYRFNRLFLAKFFLIILISCSHNRTASNPPIYIDYFGEAEIAYDNQDYKEAFDLFEMLAKNGWYDAQHYLWVMYYNGQGVKKNFYQGFAWLSLAAESGDKLIREEYAEVIVLLTDQQRKKAKAEADKLAALYGNAVPLAADIEPLFISGAEPDYPQVAIDNKKQGYVILSFSITTEGKTQDVVVIKSSDEMFEAPSINAVKSYIFRPAIKAGNTVESVNVKTTTLFKFKPSPTSDALEPSVTINSPCGEKYLAVRDWNEIILEAIPLMTTPPGYPEKAARRGIEGWVILQFTINTDGKVKDIKVIESSNKIFIDSSISALKTWKFQPVKVNNKLVEAPNIRYTLIYKLEPKAEGVRRLKL